MIRIITVILSLVLTSAVAAESGSMSKSCSGTMEICDGPVCMQKFFYLYAFQYAFIFNGEVVSESHTFSFSGVLGDEDAYVMQKRVSGRHILYVGPEITIAVPWDDKEPILAVQGIGGPGSWQTLCK